MSIERVKSRELLGKVLISEESSKKIGAVGDLDFVAESGELVNLIVVEPTRHANELALKEDEKGRMLVPFAAVRSVGDFILVAEKDMG